MSVWEYERRLRMDERIEAGIAELLARPTVASDGPAILEEHAELFVRQAIQLRELAELWRRQVAETRAVA